MARRLGPAPKYSMKQLSLISGLSPRAIRRYVAEGVLSRPEGKTSAARYNQRQLAQLTRIKSLIDRGLTLKKIQQQLDYDASRPATQLLGRREEQVRREIGIAPGIVVGLIGNSAKLTAEQERRFLERVIQAYEDTRSEKRH